MRREQMRMQIILCMAESTVGVMMLVIGWEGGDIGGPRGGGASRVERAPAGGWPSSDMFGALFHGNLGRLLEEKQEGITAVNVSVCKWGVSLQE